MKPLDLFRKPTPLEVAMKELEQAQLARLEAHSAEEYARAMGQYHDDRIERLTRYINTLAEGV